MNSTRMTCAACTCLARQLRAGLQRRCTKAATTINSIATLAIFYCARGLKEIEKRAENDEFLRATA
jgi:hypothetical protein